MAFRKCTSIDLLLPDAPESANVFLGSKTRSYFLFLTESANPCGLGGEKVPSCERKTDEGTYDPSVRFDSGMTRSRVLGSTAMPDGVVSGYRAGLDIVQSFHCEE